MLATILKSPIATEISISIMDAFVAMKKYISSSLIEQNYYNKMIIKHDNEIKLLQESFAKLSTKEKNNHIFFEGQIYDAYSLLLDIFNKSRKEIIIIDNYANKELLDIVSKTNKNIIIISSNIDKILINKYMKQYNNLKIINDFSFHDRFIIVDRKVLYHCGASFKDLGKKCFAINKMDDDYYLSELLKKIYK